MFLEEIERTASKPAGNYLFNIRDPAEKTPTLPEEQIVDFHRDIEQLLFVICRA